MIFKISTLLTLGLALSSLDAVTAISVSNRSVNVGQLDRRGDKNIPITVFHLPVGAIGSCGTFYTEGDYAVALLPPFQYISNHCGTMIIVTFGNVKSRPLKVVDICENYDCVNRNAINLTPAAFQELSGGKSSDGDFLYPGCWEDVQE